MTDLLTTLPSFPTTPYTHLLPSLERSLITTSDLLTLDALEIAKRAQLPILDVKRLASHILETLHDDIGFVSRGDQADPIDASSDEKQANERSENKLETAGQDVVGGWSTISLLDDILDEALGGGIPTGYITEVTGERYHRITFTHYSFHSNTSTVEQGRPRSS
jgi:DNA repair protein RAD57